MANRIKEEWVINNQNVFGLTQNISLSLSSIQYEILNQIKNKKVNTLSDYLEVQIDVNKEIPFTQSLTIQGVFSEFLGFENIAPLIQPTLGCYLILSYLQLSLFKEYTSVSHKNILAFSEYKSQYNNILSEFLSTNIDTDEHDFIKSEIALCEALNAELNKPIYDVISPFNEILQKPCDFKKNLINSLDKRRKFLGRKQRGIPEKIIAVFHFIEFLHSNIDNFKLYLPIVEECINIRREMDTLNPNDNFENKTKHEKLNELKNKKFDIVYSNVTQTIIGKAIELDICFYNTSNRMHEFNWGFSEIQELKKNANEDDLPFINSIKSKYLEYKKNINSDFLSLTFFFEVLQEYSKEIFVFFDKNAKGKFEEFENKAIPVNSITEAIRGFKQGHSKFTLPNTALLNPLNNGNHESETLSPQPKKVGTPISIVSVIHFQLSKIIHLLKDDLQEKKVTYNYFFCEDEFSFLNKNELQEYLTETQVENQVFLKRINKMCSTIIKIWNDDFADLPDRKFDFVYSNPKDKNYINTQLEFHAFYLSKDNKWHGFNTRHGKEEFVKNYNYNIYGIDEIAQRCALILNWVTDAYPDTTPTEPNTKARTKQNLEPDKKLISISNPEIITKLFDELKGYFPNKEVELKKALEGEKLTKLLLFPHNQNKFVEVFKRLKYNGFLLSTPKEIKNWICSNFCYQYRKGAKTEVRNFNPSTVHDILTKDKGEPTKNERICLVDWLPYKSHLNRKREAD